MSTRRERKRGWILWVIVIVGVILVVNLSRGVWELLSVKDRLIEAEREVALLEEERMRLEEQYAYQTTSEYAEKEIRDKLRMAKPDEVVVLVPSDQELEGGGRELVKREDESKPREYYKNWEKWIGLFY